MTHKMIPTLPHTHDYGDASEVFALAYQDAAAKYKQVLDALVSVQTKGDYAKCDALEDVREVFDALTIAAVQLQNLMHTKRLFDQMQEQMKSKAQ